MRRIVTMLQLVVVFVLVGMPLAGCVVGMGGCDWQSARYAREMQVSVAHVAGTGLDLQTENGKVSVVRGSGSEVMIKATVHASTQERADGARVTAERSAGADASGEKALVVRVDWPGGKREPSEGCSMEVSVPETAWVRVKSSNGGITIENLGGTADLKTSNSAIQVNGHKGDVTAVTSNGGVRASNVAGSLRAETSNSSMTIADVGGFVHASTSNGGITASLGGESKGPVRLKASNGSISVLVPTSFGGTMELKTSNGTIRHEGLGSTVYSGSHTSGTLKFGGSGEASTVETSNGSITVKGR